MAEASNTPISPHGPDGRNALARFDQQILSLQKEHDMALMVASEAKDHAYRLGHMVNELVAIRRQMKPMLDPSAPVEIV